MKATMKERNIDLDLLRKTFNYDPKAGLLTKNGKVVGSKNRDGYMSVGIFGGKYLLHRIIYYYVTGTVPRELDHINRNKSDNRFDNLRVATRSENNRNKSRREGAGVYWHKASQSWTARINVNLKEKTLGYFKDKKDAIAVRQKAESKYNYK